MVDIAVTFGADKTKAKQELKTALELEMNLVNVNEVQSFPNIAKNGKKSIGI